MPGVGAQAIGRVVAGNRFDRDAQAPPKAPFHAHLTPLQTTALLSSSTQVTDNAVPSACLGTFLVSVLVGKTIWLRKQCYKA